MSDDGIFETLLASGTILAAGVFVQLGINFVARLVLARVLGRVDYGAVSLGLTLMVTVGIVIMLGTDTGVGRYLPRKNDVSERRGVLVSAFGIVGPVAVMAGAVVFVLAGPIADILFDGPSSVPVVRAFAVAIPFLAVFRLTVGTIRGNQESLPRVLLQNISLPIVRFGLIVVVLLAGFSSVGVAWAYAGSYALVALGSLYYLRRRTPLFERVAPSPMYRELLEFSAPLMVVATMNVILSNVDTLMLGAFASMGDVGVYNVAYPMASLLTVVLGSFGFLFMPIISELHADGEMDGLRRTYEVVSKWIFVATLPLFLLLVTYPGVIIRAAFGSEYVAGGVALAVLAVGFFTHAVAGPCGNMLTALGKTRLVMYDNTLVAAVNVALNLFLIPRYSFLGAAAATTVGYLLMNVLYVAQLNQALDIHPFRKAAFAPGIGAVLLWGAFTAVVALTLTVTPAVVFGTFVAFSIAYLGLFVELGGIEREELRLLRRAEERTGLDPGTLSGAVERFVD